MKSTGVAGEALRNAFGTHRRAGIVVEIPLLWPQKHSAGAPDTGSRASTNIILDEGARGPQRPAWDAENAATPCRDDVRWLSGVNLDSVRRPELTASRCIAIRRSRPCAPMALWEKGNLMKR